jgi:selenocysteine lyase/cysteine desulfurase
MEIVRNNYIYLNANSTSWPKLNIFSDEEFSLQNLDIRSDMRHYNDSDTSFENLLKEYFGFPFDVGVIVTGGATEALNVAVNSMLSSIVNKDSIILVDFTSHDAITSALRNYSLRYKISDSSIMVYGFQEINLLSNLLARNGYYVIQNMAPSFGFPEYEGPYKRSNGKINTQMEIYPPEGIILDASQYINWRPGIFNIPKLAKLADRTPIMIAFGLHKKLRLLPGIGILVYNRNVVKPSYFKRCITGGGVPTPYKNDYSMSKFPAGTFNPTEYNRFYKILETIVTTGNQKIVDTVAQIANIEVMQDLRMILQAQPDIHLFVTDNGRCFTLLDRDGGIEKSISTINRYFEMRDLSPIYRTGKFCCELYFDTINRQRNRREVHSMVRLSI